MIICQKCKTTKPLMNSIASSNTFLSFFVIVAAPLNNTCLHLIILFFCNSMCGRLLVYNRFVPEI